MYRDGQRPYRKSSRSSIFSLYSWGHPTWLQDRLSHSSPLRSITQNMHSAIEHPKVIHDYLRKECALGRMLCPFGNLERGSCPSIWLPIAGHGAGRCLLYWSDAPLWPPIHAKDFQRCSRCVGMAPAPAGYPPHFHYLDDFIIVAPPDSPKCSMAVPTHNRVCTYLITKHNWDGPTTCLTFLGIEVDKKADELRLPAEKLQHLKIILDEWGNKVCSRRELESQVGLLSHASKWWEQVPHFCIACWTCSMASPCTGWGLTPYASTQIFVRICHGGILSFRTGMRFYTCLHTFLLWAACRLAWHNHRVLCQCDNHAVVACLCSRTSKHRHCILHCMLHCT